jgi:hypothetical protein
MKEKKYVKDKQLVMEAPKDIKFPIYIDTTHTTRYDGTCTYNELFHLVKYGKMIAYGHDLNERKE